MRGDLAIPASALGPDVRLFDASDNAFGGPPPGPPRRATRVGVWDVSGNALEGPAPFGPGNAVPASLRVLGMARMRGVTGTLPEETFRPEPEEGEVRRGEVRSGPNENPSVGVATREASASAGSESLRGGHPPSELRRVDLSGCSLSGSLPRSLMALSHARVVNVSDNAFTGAIPSEGDVDARRMARLQAFDASNNRLDRHPPAVASGPRDAPPPGPVAQPPDRDASGAAAGGPGVAQDAGSAGERVRGGLAAGAGGADAADAARRLAEPTRGARARGPHHRREPRASGRVRERTRLDDARGEAGGGEGGRKGGGGE